MQTYHKRGGDQQNPERHPRFGVKSPTRRLPMTGPVMRPPPVDASHPHRDHGQRHDGTRQHGDRLDRVGGHHGLDSTPRRIHRRHDTERHAQPRRPPGVDAQQRHKDHARSREQDRGHPAKSQQQEHARPRHADARSQPRFQNLVRTRHGLPHQQRDQAVTDNHKDERMGRQLRRHHRPVGDHLTRSAQIRQRADQRGKQRQANGNRGHPSSAEQVIVGRLVASCERTARRPASGRRTRRGRANPTRTSASLPGRNSSHPYIDHGLVVCCGMPERTTCGSRTRVEARTLDIVSRRASAHSRSCCGCGEVCCQGLDTCATATVTDRCPPGSGGPASAQIAGRRAPPEARRTTVRGEPHEPPLDVARLVGLADRADSRQRR